MHWLKLGIHEGLETIGEDVRHAEGEDANMHQVQRRVPEKRASRLNLFDPLQDGQAEENGKDGNGDVEKDVKRAHGLEGGPALAAEQGTKEAAPVLQVGETEKDPTQEDKEKGVEMAEDTGDLFEQLFEPTGFECQEKAEIATPEEEIPAGAMPETGQEEDEENVGRLAEEFDLAAFELQGDEEVGAEPGGEGHVPAAPELGDGLADVGVVEVFGQFEAQHAAQAKGHVGVAGKIKKDGQGIGDQTKPGDSGTDRRGISCEDLVGGDGETVGDEDLFGQANNEAADAQRNIGQVDPELEQAGFDVLIAGDGTLDQFGKHHQIGGEVEDVLFGLFGASMDIENVGKSGKGQVGDAEG